jgi:NDP-sugar pyrophosphorylase family protein
MKAILLVGGLGTRLRPLTLEQPKALLPILNKPFLSYQLDLLRNAGIHDVMLAAGKNSKVWETSLRRLNPRKINFHFSYEPNPLGTGGAIRFAYNELKRKGMIDGEPLLVFNGDVFFELDVTKFSRFHRRRKSAATIAITKVDDPSRYGLVDTDEKGRVKRFIEKPKHRVPTNHINAGAYLLEPATIEGIANHKVISVERDVFPQLLAEKKGVYGFKMNGYWNDIGTHGTFLAAHRDLLRNNRWTRGKYLRKRTPSSPAPRSHVLMGNQSRVGKGVRLAGFVCCGKNVFIGNDSTIQDSVVMDGVRLGRGVDIRSAIIGPGCQIGDFAKIKEGSVLGKGTTISKYSRC